MAQQQLDAFLSSFSNEKHLHKHLKDGMAASQFAASMKEAGGFDFSAADIIRHQCRQIANLSDTELEEIAPSWPVHLNELLGINFKCKEI